MTRADRLKDAIVRSPLKSIRKFHEAIAEKPVPGNSYPVIYRYLKGTAVPPVEFLEAAAEILGVKPAWLAFGTGPRDDEEERVQRVQAEREEVERPSAFIEAYIEFQQQAGITRHGQKDALQRFVDRLLDADFAEAPWSDHDARRELYKMVLGFLVRVDAVFQEVTELAGEHSAGLVQTDSISKGWYVMWSDAIIHAFSLRVKGLGERTGEFWDSHTTRRGTAPPEPGNVEDDL